MADAAWGLAKRKLQPRLTVQWDGTNWTDETDNLIGYSAQLPGMADWQTLGGNAAAQPARTATFEMFGADGRYSPYNSGGALYSYISSGKGYGIGIRFDIGIVNRSTDTVIEWQRVFTGYILTLPMGSVRNSEVTISATDAAGMMTESRVSSQMLQGYRADDILTYITGTTLGGAYSTDIDAGLVEIPYACLDDEPAWDEMCKIAHAEGGRLFVDRDGVITFRNLEAYATNSRYNTAQHNFVVSNMMDLAYTWDIDNCYNEVIVVTQPLATLTTDTVGSLGEVVTISAGESVDITVRYKKMAINQYLGEITAYSAAGVDYTASIGYSLTHYAMQTVATLTNNHAYKTLIVKTLDIYGNPVTGRQGQQFTETASDSDIGDPDTYPEKKRTLRVTRNEYIQTTLQGTFCADMLIDRVKKYRSTFIVSAPAMPNLDPYDRVSVTEATTGISKQGFIVNISEQFSAGAYTASYEIIDATDWLLGTDYFVVGTSQATDGTNSDYAFY